MYANKMRARWASPSNLCATLYAYLSLELSRRFHTAPCQPHLTRIYPHHATMILITMCTEQGYFKSNTRRRRLIDFPLIGAESDRLAAGLSPNASRNLKRFQLTVPEGQAFPVRGARYLRGFVSRRWATPTGCLGRRLPPCGTGTRRGISGW